MLFTQSLILEKLTEQSNPRIVFADIDGTLFTAGPQIVRSPWYNTKTRSYLFSHGIPLILVTGRSDWKEIDKIQTQLLGVNKPDAVITACGTIIYEKEKNDSYTRDLVWESQMHYTKVAWSADKTETWNKLDITQKVTEYLSQQNIPFRVGTGNTFEIRIKVSNIPINQLENIRKDILSLFPRGVRVVFTEKLLWPNTLDIFSGDILLLPKNAGKENAVKYLLEKYAKQLSKPIDTIIFGDATVDVDMLSMKANSTYYSLSQYLINPTPLARKAITEAMKTNENIHIVDGDGPEIIWRVVSGQALNVKPKALSEKEENSSRLGSGNNARPPETDSGSSQQSNNKIMKQSPLSPAQNNPARQIVKKFEPLLDRIVDKNLSPNEVSFLGLTKLSEGLEQVYDDKASPLNKMKGLYNYGFGNFTDVLDGVRARHSTKREENGQLVDGFSDRAKEFMQLFIRAKRRMEKQKEEGMKTLLTALSCALPSIARAQVEITGGVVTERDEKGGSMIDRTKKLFTSLLMDIINAHHKSMAIDSKIYSTNMATFQHRLSYTKVPLAKILDTEYASLSDFQKKALERWLLYIDVLQQENSIINIYLCKQSKLLKEYENKSQKLAKEYLSLDVNKLRKKWKIKDYKLQIKDYIC